MNTIRALGVFRLCSLSIINTLIALEVYDLKLLLVSCSFSCQNMTSCYVHVHVGHDMRRAHEPAHCHNTYMRLDVRKELRLLPHALCAEICEKAVRAKWAIHIHVIIITFPMLYVFRTV